MFVTLEEAMTFVSELTKLGHCSTANRLLELVQKDLDTRGDRHRVSVPAGVPNHISHLRRAEAARIQSITV